VKIRPQGERASQLRQLKHQLLGELSIPAEAIAGSLAQTHRRCGKPTCHCATGVGHPQWLLTFMLDGKKHVERIPEDWVEEVQRRVGAGREFKRALTEVFTANAQLLVLLRQQRGR
jgi:Family of unknown function (DUF6788)